MPTRFSPLTTGVAVGVLVLIVAWNRLIPRVPGYIVALTGRDRVYVALTGGRSRLSVRGSGASVYVAADSPSATSGRI
jgi:MFS superfamily sulfate permease-like transporter